MDDKLDDLKDSLYEQFSKFQGRPTVENMQKLEDEMKGYKKYLDLKNGFEFGQKVKTHLGDIGKIVGFNPNPKMKPIVVELAKERQCLGKTLKVGFYHYEQIEVIK